MSISMGPDGRVTVTPGVVDVCVLRRVPVTGRERATAGPGHAWRVLALERGPNTRCPGSWELVHGKIEAGERPEAAALRETREETGCAPERLYSVTVNAFYLARGGGIQLALVFAAIVAGDAPVVLGPEHVASAWLTPAAAARRLTWPREREALQHVLHLLRTGDAGPAEDVLRVPLPARPTHGASDASSA